MPPDPAYLGYRTASAVARLLPGAAIGPASRLAGRVAVKLMPDRARMVARHQRRARPDLTEAETRSAVDAAFSSYVHYWLESFRLPGTDVETLSAGITLEGLEYVDEGLAAGKGVILALPHLGGWEWAGFWLTAVHGAKVSVVVEQVQPPELAAWFSDLRERFGMEIIPLDKSAGTRCMAALADNHVLCLLSDRDISGGGIAVDFLGERTTIPGGPATIAIRSGAPLVPAAVYFDGQTHHGVAHPPIDTTRKGKLRDDAARVSQVLADELAALIRAEPEQWHLLQPNWPSDRLGEDDHADEADEADA
jgi:lauroyl/myristoyl acyltransferase